MSVQLQFTFCHGSGHIWPDLTMPLASLVVQPYGSPTSLGKASHVTRSWHEIYLPRACGLPFLLVSRLVIRLLIDPYIVSLSIRRFRVILLVQRT